MERQLTPIDIARERTIAAEYLLQQYGWQVDPLDITFIEPSLHGRWQTSPPRRAGKYWTRRKAAPEKIEIVEIVVEVRNASRSRFKQMGAAGTTDLNEDEAVQWWTEPIRNPPS